MMSMGGAVCKGLGGGHVVLGINLTEIVTKTRKTARKRTMSVGMGSNTCVSEPALVLVDHEKGIVGGAISHKAGSKTST
jgi:hypothetical protein